VHCEDWTDTELNKLRKAGLERALQPYPQAGGKIGIAGRAFLNFASNDYLDLAHNPQVIAASRRMLDQYGAGATASRLVVGTLACHAELEQELARFKGYPAALVFGSGYLANAGLITAVAGHGDMIFADRLAHASILDAAVLSRARLHRFRHNDPDHLAMLLQKTQRNSGRRLVVTESIFSMDGDIAPLRAIAEIAVRHGAMLMVDEAHSTGIFGPGGSGLVRELHLEKSIDLAMGTFSKALGGYGGFVACSERMRRLLINRARAFMYTTALSPAAIGAALGALTCLAQRPDLGAQLLANADFFRRRLQTAGLNTGESRSQIIPLMVGDNGRVVSLAERLRTQGILVAAIRPPTVPAGTARLRLSLSLAHSRDDLDRVAAAIVRMMQEDHVDMVRPPS
jgi:glycine C-acetyltransferase/8-amino-7-oxononanoate synthase